MSSAARAPQTLLFKAIDHADQDVLGLVLKEIIKAAPEVVEIAESYLLVSKSELDSGTEDKINASENDDEKSDHPRKKQKREIKGTPAFVERYRLCPNCHKKFDVSENNDDACRFHPGDLFEVDDYWIDECEGDDYEHDVAEDPEGFQWSCCDRQGDDKGCKVQKHETEDEHVQRIQRS